MREIGITVYLRGLLGWWVAAPAWTALPGCLDIYICSCGDCSSGMADLMLQNM